MRELLYQADKHYTEGRYLAERQNVRGALESFQHALRDLHAVRPHRRRNVLLAQVYLARYQLALDTGGKPRLSDLRTGYSYAKTTKESAVRTLAESLWQTFLAQKPSSITRS